MKLFSALSCNRIMSASDVAWPIVLLVMSAVGSRPCFVLARMICCGGLLLSGFWVCLLVLRVGLVSGVLGALVGAVGRFGVFLLHHRGFFGPAGATKGSLLTAGKGSSSLL